MIHFAPVNLKNWVAGYLCSLKIKYLHPVSSEIAHQPKTEQNKKNIGKKENLFIYLLLTYLNYISCQQEEHQAATLPGEQQWSGGTMCWTGTQWLPIRKNTTHIIRKVQGRGPSGHFIIPSYTHQYLKHCLLSCESAGKSVLARLQTVWESSN